LGISQRQQDCHNLWTRACSGCNPLSRQDASLIRRINN